MNVRLNQTLMPAYKGQSLAASKYYFVEHRLYLLGVPALATRGQKA